MTRLTAALGLYLLTTLAHAQEVAEPLASPVAPVPELPGLPPDWVLRVTPYVLGGMAALRVVSELMLRVAPLLGQHGPTAVMIGRALWAAGQFAGALGIGTPTPIKNMMATGTSPFKKD